MQVKILVLTDLLHPCGWEETTVKKIMIIKACWISWMDSGILLPIFSNKDTVAVSW